MKINKIERKIKALELFRKAKHIETQRNLVALAKKKNLLYGLEIDNQDITREIGEIEIGIIANTAEVSAFNSYQKYHYLLSLDERANVLSHKMAINQHEVSDLESRIKTNSNLKNKVKEKIAIQYSFLSIELEKKHLSDIC